MGVELVGLYMKFFSAVVADYNKGRRNLTTIHNTGALDGKIDENSVRLMWNLMHEQYLYSESMEAHLGTSIWIERVLKKSNGKLTENWLGIGCGPALHELYWAGICKPKRLDLVDLSNFQLTISKHRVSEKAVPGVSHRTFWINSSMNSLPLKSGSYEQIFSLNSLHWSTNWRQAVFEVGRVLSDKPGSRIYSVTSSAAILTEKGKHVLNPDLNSDAVIWEYERRGMVLKKVCQLNIDNAQYEKPTNRFMCVFERGTVPKIPFEMRMLDGTIEYSEISVAGDKVVTKDFRR